MLPLVTLPTRGWCCGSPPDITCVSSIHAQAKIPAIEMLVPAMDVPLLSTSATWLPLGERYCSFGSGIAMVRTEIGRASCRESGGICVIAGLFGRKGRYE